MTAGAGHTMIPTDYTVPEFKWGLGTRPDVYVNSHTWGLFVPIQVPGANYGMILHGHIFCMRFKAALFVCTSFHCEWFLKDFVCNKCSIYLLFTQAGIEFLSPEGQFSQIHTQAFSLQRLSLAVTNTGWEDLGTKHFPHPLTHGCRFKMSFQQGIQSPKQYTQEAARVVIDQRVVLVFFRNLVLYVAAWPDPLHEVEQSS